MARVDRARPADMNYWKLFWRRKWSKKGPRSGVRDSLKSIVTTSLAK